MSRPQRPRARIRLALASVTAGLVLASAIPFTSASAAEPPASMLLQWNANANAAIFSLPTATPAGAGQTPPVGSIHLAMVETAVYDAVNAIDRGHEPYLKNLPRPSRSASKAAAVATAAHHVLVGLVPALPDGVKANLDAAYTASLATIPGGWRKNAGISIGATVAARMLANRANDGRYVPYSFTPGTGIGQWRPELPMFVSDPFAWVSNVRPFAIGRASRFRTAGPLDIHSAAYAREVNEVKSVGSSTSTTRTAAQTALGMFYTANPIPMLNKSLRDIVVRKGLSITRAARLFAMTSVSGADALIGCWDDKDHYSFWRPITAIRSADVDGNPGTTVQADWLPMFPNPPYPDHPSGYNCLTGATTQAAREFFGTNYVRITLTSPVTTTSRTYSRLSSIVNDTINARVYLGIHFRTPDVQGAKLGRQTAAYVADHLFERVD
jgi:vanadium-dependent haloperoxidase-like protein